jgi:outer membrane protein assembly factor BamC
VENGQTVIELDLNFARAWSSVSKAMTAANITSNDRDRSNGIFYVSYEQQQDKSFFSFMGFKTNQKKSSFSEDADFEVKITEKDNKTYVRAYSKNGKIEESEELLSKINELLS